LNGHFHLLFGLPTETIEFKYQNGDFKYWRDENRVHHVPKRSLDEIIIRF